jgi:predicted enzyme related to lactoylglutathione lyase
MKINPVGWFEIPVNDMSRAVSFYNAIFGYKLEAQKFGELEMAWFPFDESKNGASGSLVKEESFYVPSETHGVVIYFSVEDIEKCTELAPLNGGKVIQEKKIIGDNHGFMALISDSEGNRIALHSNK